ncbi:MAG: phosphopyruvate hydratase, partial [Armatimonadetes bacterium]|nr:phosphopyruvate hydratase [Armatimonadota bacterium]
VRQAVHNVRTVLAEAVNGLDPADQERLDQALVEADGTPNKSRLGANATLAVSLAAARAAAADQRLPLYRHLNQVLFPNQRLVCPLPMVNILSGGHHAGFQLDIQDLLIIPLGAGSTAEALEWTNAVYYSVREILQREIGYQQLVADEGGFGPELARNEEMLRVVTAGIEAAELTPGEQVVIAVDVASSHFYQPGNGQYVLSPDGLALSPTEMIDLLAAWCEHYPIVSLEDGLAEEDWDNWPALTQALGDRVQLVGDDLLATNVARLRRAVELGAGNSVLVKVNQIGTLSEAALTCRTAYEAGYTAVISARSGETEDSFLADLACASGAGQIKIGSIARSERLAKYNQMLRIEEELGEGHFTGRAAFARWR